MVALCAIFLVVMIVIGSPVAYGIGLFVTMILFLTTEIPLKVVPQMMTSAVNSFPLMAIPFFMLAGALMNTAGITRRLFEFANCLVGHITGGLGHVNVAASMLFAGMSGSAVADAAGLGTVEIEAMTQYGYDRDFSAGITAASATIGPVIPPSIIFIIYGVLAEVSIGALFLAGFIPGVLMGLSLMVRIYLIARKKDYPVFPRPPLRHVLRSFKAASLPLLTPVIIIGGILAGVFTPTEAAVVAVVYALFLGTVYRELTLRSLWKTIHRVGIQTATIMIITATANVLGWVLTRSRIPQLVAESILTVTDNPYLILLFLNILLLVNGCVMEVIAALVILTPILVPMVKMVGIDPVHFGVVMTLNLMIGLLTPPLGVGLYTVQKVAGISFERTAKAAFPFLLPLIIVLLLVTYVPDISLFLAHMVLKSP
ncbi:MAG: TRAP transporter large permease subunit [candidate division Zixibacteria bacterium]|nr:TRAP transporter large permease subunit [candidate division Zixibacteria bacterium]